MLNQLRVGAVLAVCGGAVLTMAPAPEALKPFVKEDAPVLVLEHVRVIDGTGDAAREDQRVMIYHGKILSVGPESDDAKWPEGAKALDLTGKTVFPGLVGMHEHLFYPLPEGGPGLLPLYGEMADSERSDDDEDREQQLPRLVKDERAAVLEITSEEKETQPPRRYSEGALLAAMETAGKLVDEEELREAMKDSGIGTPATRAAIIERLLQVGYIERDARALVVTEKGLNVIRLLGEHPLTSPGLTGDWEHRLAKIETGEDSREAFMGDIVKFTEATVGELDAKLKDVRIPRANLGPCPVCGRDIVENRKGYSCWSREDPGCGFVIWKSKAGKQLPLVTARELIKTGRTARAVTGFKGRSGKSFRARLALQQNEDGKWRAEFDEPWAKEGAKPPEAEAESADALAAEPVAASASQSAAA